MSRATDVKVLSKYNESVRVFAARIAPRAVVKMEAIERIKIMTSRFHSGQFYVPLVVSLFFPVKMEAY